MIPAVVFGDPHFVTFDGMQYSFNGKGEYTLVASAKENLTIQGRTAPVNRESATFRHVQMSPMRVFCGAVTSLIFVADARFLAASDSNLNATKLTSTAMQEKQSDVIEVRLGEGGGLEVLRNQQALNFGEQSWMDLNGELLVKSSKRICRLASLTDQRESR